MVVINTKMNIIIRAIKYKTTMSAFGTTSITISLEVVEEWTYDPTNI